MSEIPLPRMKMTDQERQQFVRKAKADATAWQIAERLSRSQPIDAAKLADTALSLVGPERFAFWVRHYAVMKFGLTAASVRAFLAGVMPEARAA